MDTRERLARAINPVAWIVETHDKARAESLLAADRVLSIFPDLSQTEVDAFIGEFGEDVASVLFRNMR
jgi:hypothetical protein